MKIVHILHNLRGGGIQNLLLSLAPMQAKMGNEVTLILTDEDNMDYSIKMRDKIEKKNVTVIYLNRKVGSTFSSIVTLFKCYRLLHELRADIINSHGAFNHNYAALCTVFTKNIHIPTIHSSPEKWNKLGYWLNKKKSMIFCSQSSFEINNYKSSNSIIIANGVDKEMVVSIKKSNLHKELNINSNIKLVAGVGALRVPKNYPFWVKIAKACKDIDVHFIVCGGDKGQDFISASIFDGIENLTWVGIRSDIPEIINEADCFLSCSTFEGLPIAVLEAFFSGIPCVLSPIPQHSDIAKNISECYIPEKFEIQDFKENIIKACSSGKSHQTIKKERELFIENFSIERTAKEYIDFYKKCISN